MNCIPIFVEGTMRNISGKLFELRPVVKETCLIQSSDRPFVWWSETISAILEEGIMRNIAVK